MTKKKRNIFASLTSRVLMIVAASLLALSYISAFVNPQVAWFFVLLEILFFPLVLLNLALLVAALIRRSKSAWIPAVVLLPALLFIGRVYKLPSSTSRVEPLSDLRIVSYNVGRFAPFGAHKNMSRKECLDSVAAFLRSTDADIICLQEFYLSYEQDLSQVLLTEFGKYWATCNVLQSNKGVFGNIILSKYHPVDRGEIRFEKSTNMVVSADYMIGGRRCRVYNCHLESYNMSMSSIVKSFREEPDVISDTGRKLRKSILRRSEQVARVFAHISTAEVPAIVCGDFNDTPVSYTYNVLSRGRRDSFTSAGSGFGASYSLLWPLLRIDYLFYPDSMNALAHRCPKVKYSDHYPVVVDLSIWK